MLKRTITVLIVIAAVIAGVSFVVAPVVAFHALRSAAQAQDVQGLAQLVDFDQVRAGLRAQLSESPGAQIPAPDPLQDPIGAFKHAIDPLTRPQPRPPEIEGYLTPEGLEGLTLGEGRAANRADFTLEGEAPMPQVVYWGVNRNRMTVAPAGSDQTTRFTFERRGIYTWKLVNVALPTEEETPSQPAAPAPAAK